MDWKDELYKRLEDEGRVVFPVDTFALKWQFGEFWRYCVQYKGVEVGTGYDADRGEYSIRLLGV